MKKLILISFLICIMIILNSCSQNNTANNTAVFISGTKYGYVIEVDYNPEKRILNGNQRLYYINDIKTDKIYFHLYSNAYSSEKTAPEYISIPNSYPNGFNEGYIDISAVKINGTDVAFKEDDQLLEIDIPADLRQAESFTIDIAFKSLLPNAKTRYGRFEKLTHASYWYPILAVYEKGQWDKTPFNPIGESSHSHIADYIVKITVPKKEIICATGEKIEEKNVFFNKKTYTFKETNIRDFAWFSSEEFKVSEINENGIVYRYYYFDENADKPNEVLQQTKSIFEFYNNSFGSLPYKQFSVVKTNVAASEFPKIVTITEDNIKDSKNLRMGLAHEIAHQWWYLAVGNNQNKEPWLDETLASYSMHLYNNEIFGDIATKLDIVDRYPSRSYELPINSPVSAFKNMSEYGDVVYNLGCVALYELHAKLGDQALFKILNTYYRRNILQNASTNGFLESIKEVAGSEISEWFGSLIAENEHKAVTKQQKESMQLQIMSEETEKLASGEILTFQRMLWPDKTLYKAIQGSRVEDFIKYEDIMPILKIQTLGGLNLDSINMEPDPNLLNKISKEKYGKQRYEIANYNDLAACAYLYGKIDGEMIIVYIAPNAKDSNVNKMHNSVISRGEPLQDNTDIYFYKYNNNNQSAAFDIKYKGNSYGITIITNINDDSLDFTKVATTIYENLSKQ